MSSLSCARQEDIVLGICYEHRIQFIGLIMGGASISQINNRNMAQMSNIVIGFCGHVGTVVTSSNITSIEDLGSARQFDMVIGEGVIANIMSGSGNTYTEWGNKYATKISKY